MNFTVKTKSGARNVPRHTELLKAAFPYVSEGDALIMPGDRHVYIFNFQAESAEDAIAMVSKVVPDVDVVASKRAKLC